MAGGRNSDDAKEKIDPNYFKLAPLGWSLITVSGMCYFALVSYFPDVPPYQYLGPLGKLSLYLQAHYMKQLKVGFQFAVSVHVFEAMFAVNICRRLQLSAVTTVKWAVQTFIVGFPSLGLLLRCSKRTNKAKAS